LKDDEKKETKKDSEIEEEDKFSFYFSYLIILPFIITHPLKNPYLHVTLHSLDGKRRY
jgi:hypothetical protein